MIVAPSGYPVRNDNLTNYAYVGGGSGTTPPEQYLAYHADNTGDRSPIEPGQTLRLQSAETGMWCQLRPLPSNATQIGMICDQLSPDTATVMTYTGDGLSYNGVRLVATGGPGTTLLLENTTTTPVVGAGADHLSLVPVTTPPGTALTGPQAASMQCSGTMMRHCYLSACIICQHLFIYLVTGLLDNIRHCCPVDGPSQTP